LVAASSSNHRNLACDCRTNPHENGCLSMSRHLLDECRLRQVSKINHSSLRRSGYHSFEMTL
jgi:hypothetical protein